MNSLLPPMSSILNGRERSLGGSEASTWEERSLCPKVGEGDKFGCSVGVGSGVWKGVGVGVAISPWVGVKVGLGIGTEVVMGIGVEVRAGSSAGIGVGDRVQ